MKALCLLPNVVLLLTSIMYEWKVGYVFQLLFRCPFCLLFPYRRKGGPNVTRCTSGKFARLRPNNQPDDTSSSDQTSTIKISTTTPGFHQESPEIGFAWCTL